MLSAKQASHITLAAVVILCGTFSFTAQAETDNHGLGSGKAGLQSAGALEFGPDGVLFVGDSKGASVWALDVGETASEGEPPETIEDLDEQVAAMLGVGVRDLSFEDMEVHRESGSVFLSVARGRGENTLPVLIKVGRDGKISALDLDNIRHSRFQLSDAPAEDAKLYRWESRTFTITDLEFIEGELYIAGLSNEEFASTLRRVPFPFDGKVKATGLEIYHGAHGAYETFAPIFSFIPYDIEGETHLLAGYLCTPLVTFPLSEVRSKDKLRGKTIAELGYGNTPTDLLAYESGGERRLLIVNSSRGTMRIKGAEIDAAQKKDGITSNAPPRTGLDDETVPLGNVAQASDYSASHLVILGRSMDNGALYLRAVPKSRV